MTTHFPRRTPFRLDSSSLPGYPPRRGKTLSPHPPLSLRLTVAADLSTTTTTTMTDERRGRCRDDERDGAHGACDVNVSGCATYGRRRLFSFDDTRQKLDANETSRADAAAAAAPSRLWRAAGRAGLRESTLVNPVRPRAAAPAADEGRARPSAAERGRRLPSAAERRRAPLGATTLPFFKDPATSGDVARFPPIFCDLRECRDGNSGEMVSRGKSTTRGTRGLPRWSLRHRRIAR